MLDVHKEVAMRQHLLSDSALTIGCLMAMFSLWPWSILASMIFAGLALGLVASLHRKAVCSAGLREGRKEQH